ncbi:MAG: hypothetical protein WAV04_03560 [Candidatus Microsaccharimonas sp.]|jgi:hypothetical protein
MAKVVAEQEYVDRTWSIWLKTIATGAALGIVFWIMTVLLSHYVVDPLACRDMGSATACANSVSLAGNIAAILTGLLGIIVMVRMGIFRPIILAVATAILLWDLSAMTTGLFWVEALAWSVGLYALCYGLFAWIARYARLWLVIAVSILIVLIIRITLVLS